VIKLGDGKPQWGGKCRKIGRVLREKERPKKRGGFSKGVRVVGERVYRKRGMEGGNRSSKGWPKRKSIEAYNLWIGISLGDGPRGRERNQEKKPTCGKGKMHAKGEGTRYRKDRGKPIRGVRKRKEESRRD